MLPSARATVRGNRYGTAFTDSFTEPNNSLLRQPWQMVTNLPGLKVAGNAAVPVGAAGTESRMCRRLPDGVASWSVTVTYGSLTGSAHQGISFLDAAPADGSDRGAVFLDSASSGVAVYVHPQAGGFANQYFSAVVPSPGSVVTYLLTRSGDTFSLSANGSALTSFSCPVATVPRVGRAIHLTNSTGGGSFDEVAVS